MEGSDEAQLGDSVPANLRWFEKSDSAPFRLARKYSSGTAAQSSAVALFPWSSESLKDLWPDRLTSEENQPAWDALIQEWAGACAVGYSGEIAIYGLQLPLRSIAVKVPVCQTGHSNIAWAMLPYAPFEPLLVISSSSLIYILNVNKRDIVSYLRGHGGAITSIVTHPFYPEIFLTTSRDHSTRIYDLQLAPIQAANNPPWPPANGPSLAGAAHGMHMTEPEGTYIGRCIAVLAGGRSGGHNGAVLGAAWHPNLNFPLIATCGVDRTVKIWRSPSFQGDMISREDKPLFSSSRIHKARVLSVTWLNDHILVSHGAPAMMRRHNDAPNDVYEEPGTLVVWRWLGLDRFFPPGVEYHQKILRGCASDYQESAACKLICVNSLPEGLKDLHIYRSWSHEPIVLFPQGNNIKMFNLRRLLPRFSAGPPPPTQHDDFVESMKRALPRLDDDDDDSNVVPPAPNVPVEWELAVTAGKGKKKSLSENLLACTMGAGGDLIVAVGATGNIWLWQRKLETTT